MKKVIPLLGLFFSAFVITRGQVPGCTDPAANNFNAAATINNGSCTYNNITLNPVLKYSLSATLNENSGLLWWNGTLWAHNDGGGGPVLYAIDSSTGNILRTVNVTNATNVDWEDLAQDADYVYIADCGNNADGNRTNLRIYRVSKNDLLSSNDVVAQIIDFSYEDQTDFSPQGPNNTNFDCEALIVFQNNLYLFTRNWLDRQTNLYELSTVPGTHTAIKLGTLNVQLLISGAEIVPDRRTIVLTGYDLALSPFLYLLYDFSNTNFFGANKRRVQLSGAFTQMEGIAMIRPDYFFLSNERFLNPPIDVPAQFKTLDVSALLNPYYIILPITFIDFKASPSGDDVELSWRTEPPQDATLYEVERRTNIDNTFHTLHKISPPSNRYSDKSAMISFQSMYYRLKVTDIDSRFYYSKEVFIKGNPGNDVTLRADRNELTVIFPAADGPSIEIFSGGGSLILKKQISSSSTTINTAFMSSGIYFIRLVQKDGARVLKFMKQ